MLSTPTETKEDKRIMAEAIWHESLAAAKAAAESEGRLLLTYFHAPG